MRAAAHPFLDWPAPIAFAHRGGASEAPENTMPAFEHAIRLGYTYLETDVHATSDGVLVAFHDRDLLRTCGRPGRIGDLPWRDVASARVAGIEPIPTLEDILGAWPEARVNIDCKADSAVDALVAAIRRTNAIDRVCIASFNDRRLVRLRQRLGPRACMALGPANLARLRYAPGSFRRPMPAVTAQAPSRQGRIAVVTPPFVRAARRLGVPVHVWTIDDPVEMERLLDLGVDGIMSDRPAELRAVLERRGQWPAGSR